MTTTALGAGAKKAQKIIFISEAHEKFYYEKLELVRHKDVYHKALIYCLGINNDTRRNRDKVSNTKSGTPFDREFHFLYWTLLGTGISVLL